MNDKLRDVLLLIRRSKPDTDGWYKVSAAVWPLLKHAPDDLVERQQVENAGGRIRLTDRGSAVLEYL